MGCDVQTTVVQSMAAPMLKNLLIICCCKIPQNTFRGHATSMLQWIKVVQAEQGEPTQYKAGGLNFISDQCI